MLAVNTAHSSWFEQTHFAQSINSMANEASRVICSTVEAVCRVAYTTIIYPAVVGIGVGMIDYSIILLSACIGAAMLFTSRITSCIASIENNGSLEITQSLVRNDFMRTTLWAPIQEELYYRGIVQGVLKWTASDILPDISFTIFSRQIKLATLVAIIVTALLFGAEHSSTLQCINATIGGVVYGLLKEEFGIVSSIAAHCTHNTLNQLFTTMVITQFLRGYYACLRFAI
jgi:membrane protease YdiL (CAAX protease family)